MIKMTYKDNYKHLKKDTIEAVKTTLFDYRFYRLTDEGKFNMLKALKDRLNEIYGTITNLSRTDEATNGFYSPINNTIYLNKLSLMTFLHEFKHSIQQQKGRKNNEDIARGWSISLFAVSSPKHYERAVEKGILFYS